MKTSTLFLTGAIALSLSACGATTGGIAKTMAKQAAVSTVTSQTNQQAPSGTVETEMPEVDVTAECATLWAQIEETDAIIAKSNETIANSGRANVAGKVAATGASQAALRSGAAGAIAKVPFGGLFAKSAMDSAANAGRKKAERAQKDLNKANLRKAKLTRLYAGKNCAN